MKNFIIFSSIIYILIFFSVGSISLAESYPAENFLGQYNADCTGTGPNKLKGQWTWIIDAVHQDEDGVDDAESLSILESTKYNERIWVVSFLKTNKGALEKVEGGVNVTSYQSELKGQVLSGSVDSYAYEDESRPKPPVFQAHWKATLKLNSKSGIFNVVYRGYNPTDDPDYSFSCNLK